MIVAKPETCLEAEKALRTGITDQEELRAGDDERRKAIQYVFMVGEPYGPLLRKHRL